MSGHHRCRQQTVGLDGMPKKEGASQPQLECGIEATVL